MNIIACKFVRYNHKTKYTDDMYLYLKDNLDYFRCIKFPTFSLEKKANRYIWKYAGTIVYINTIKKWKDLLLLPANRRVYNYSHAAFYESDLDRTKINETMFEHDFLTEYFR